MEQGETVIKGREEHGISRQNIDEDALKVLYHLNHHGHVAYLVGGGVRDLLLGRAPKDFDVSTDAHPNQIKKLFRNCFLVGRRFRLAHIRFGTKVIETSTFRRTPDVDESQEDGDLFHHRDNTFGTPEEDARRRDYTINGLFYDVRTFSVIDHVGGLKDLEQKLVRCIGDPNVRFREDPVRMVRAVRFASRLGFTIEPATNAAILEHHGEILKASPARMLEEIYRLFGFNSGESAFRLLRRTSLMSVLFPEIDIYVDDTGHDESIVWKYLAALDAGRSGLPAPTPVVMWGSLYYSLFLHRLLEQRGRGHQVRGFELAEDMLRPVARRFQIPKAVFFELVHALDMQRWLEDDPMPPAGERPGQRRISPQRVASNPAFRSALALYRLHVAAAGSETRSLQGWLQVLEQQRAGGTAGEPPSHHPHAPSQGHDHAPGRRRRRRRRSGRWRGERREPGESPSQP